eukprot:212856-Pelagomonas_calceolata.AAC.1
MLGVCGIREPTESTQWGVGKGSHQRALSGTGHVHTIKQNHARIMDCAQITGYGLCSTIKQK